MMRPQPITAAVARLRTAAVTSGFKRQAAIGFLAGSVSVLAYAPFFIWPILFLTLPVLLWQIDAAQNVRQAARAGWWFGFGYFFFNLLWLGEAFLVEADKFAVLLPFAVTLLPAGMAIFYALAASAAKYLWPFGPARIFVFALSFAAIEWLRGHVLTGLPWNVFGYALTANDTMMQSAAVVGVYGLTAVALVILTTPLVLLTDHTQSRQNLTISIALLTLAPLLLITISGWHRLSSPPTFIDNVSLRIVQPSVLQKEKWRPEHQRRIFDDHLLLSATNAAGTRDDLATTTHVIWPEAAMPFLPLEQPEALKEIAALLPDSRSLITGALRRDPADAQGSRAVYNALLVLDDKAALTSKYDKIHLVPFGEYLPFEPLLSAIGLKKLTHGLGAFAVGIAPRPLIAIPGLGPALGLICYEALFPGQIVQTPDRPAVLLNLTNDGWFGDSTGPRQHFHQSRVRAVEEGLPLIRAANNGISAVVDPYGRVLSQLGMNVRGVIDSKLPKALDPTPYARWRDLPLLALLCTFAAAAFALQRRQNAT